MKLQGKLLHFEGFYDSLLSFDYYNFIENEKEYYLNGINERLELSKETKNNCETIKTVNLNNLDINDLFNRYMDTHDYNKYQNDICKEYVSIYLSGIKEFITDIKFMNLHSPKEYNFTTDSCEVIYNITKQNKKDITDFILKNTEAFAVYLENNFKSYSGFMSFYSYDLYEWLDKLKAFSKLDYIEISSIIHFIYSTTNSYENISFEVMENIGCNGYYKYFPLSFDSFVLNHLEHI